MTPRPAFLLIATRVLLGGVYAYAGATKIADPLAVADSIASFQLVPFSLVLPMALTLPVFELVLGLLLLLNRLPGPAILGTLFLTVAFTLALSAALTRDIEVDCGCFGKGIFSNAWIALGRDLLLLAAAGFLYRRRLQLSPGPRGSLESAPKKAAPRLGYAVL